MFTEALQKKKKETTEKDKKIFTCTYLLGWSSFLGITDM